MTDQPASPRTPAGKDFIDIHTAPAAVFLARRQASGGIPLIPGLARLAWHAGALPFVWSTAGT